MTFPDLYMRSKLLTVLGVSEWHPTVKRWDVRQCFPVSTLFELSSASNSFFYSMHGVWFQVSFLVTVAENVLLKLSIFCIGRKSSTLFLRQYQIDRCSTKYPARIINNLNCPLSWLFVSEIFFFISIGQNFLVFNRILKNLRSRKNAIYWWYEIWYSLGTF